MPVLYPTGYGAEIWGRRQLGTQARNWILTIEAMIKLRGQGPWSAAVRRRKGEREFLPRLGKHFGAGREANADGYPVLKTALTDP